MAESRGKAYLLIGGLGHGEELILHGQPETYDVDGELYLRTVSGESIFYRHNSLLPEDAQKEHAKAIGTRPPPPAATC